MSEQNKIFEKETRIYKHYINSVERDAVSIDFIKTLFKMELINMDKTEEQDLVQLYNIVGFDAFFEMIALFNSKPIKLPRADKIKKLLIVAIAYYHVVMLGIPPKEVGKILTDKLGACNLKQKSVKAIVNKLQKELEELGSKYNREA